MAGVLTASERARVHSALGDAVRLAIADALVVSDRSPSELGHALSLGSNLIARHIDVLEAAGVVERVVSHGDQRRRYVRLKRETVAALFAPAAGVDATHVLFVCTQNSARSQLAAALWNVASPATADSAGTHPADRVHPRAVAVAARHGLDLANARTQSVSAVTQAYDLVVTVCDQAHEEMATTETPTWHWSVPDPAAANSAAAFEAAYAEIAERVSTAAPLAQPMKHRRNG